MPLEMESLELLRTRSYLLTRGEDKDREAHGRAGSVVFV
jgi:hypothetical protein